jgi:hypothetical protein
MLIISNVYFLRIKMKELAFHTFIASKWAQALIYINFNLEPYKIIFYFIQQED